MYSQRLLGSRSTAVPSLARASLPWAQATGLRAGANGATPLAIFPSAQLEAQRETRRIPIMQKWRAGAIKTRDQVHKKAERTRRNQERCEYQRVKLHLKQGTLYEYIEGGTADEETKRKWFHQHFGHVQPKSRIAEEVTTGASSSSSEGASSPPPQQQSFVDLDAESVRVSQ